MHLKSWLELKINRQKYSYFFSNLDLEDLQLEGETFLLQYNSISKTQKLYLFFEFFLGRYFSMCYNFCQSFYWGTTQFWKTCLFIGQQVKKLYTDQPKIVLTKLFFLMYSTHFRREKNAITFLKARDRKFLVSNSRLSLSNFCQF